MIWKKADFAALNLIDKVCMHVFYNFLSLSRVLFACPHTMQQPLAWPDIAHTKDDVYKFCQMMNPLGDSDIVDLTEFLPGNGRENSCLFQIKSSRLTDILNDIPILGQNVFEMKMAEERKINSQNPEKTLQISGSKTVYYESASINRGICQCIFKFGGENEQERVRVTYAAKHSVAGLAIEQFFVNNFLQDSSTWYRQFGCFLTVNYCHCFVYDSILFPFFFTDVYIYVHIRYCIYKYLYKYIYMYM